MSLETIFMLSFLPAAPFWFLMMFLPNWGVTRRMMRSPWIVAPAALLYTVVGIIFLRGTSVPFDNFNLATLAALFGTEAVALVGWLHFIALDLVAGSWAYLDSQARGISPILMFFVLFVILMLAPFGMLLYLVVRQIAMMRQSARAN